MPAATSKKVPARKVPAKKPAVTKPAAKKVATVPAKKAAVKKVTKAPSRPMPEFTPAPEEMVALFADAIAGLAAAETKKMFGYPAAFANGYMFAGLFQQDMFLRLSDADRAGFRSEYHARLFEPMPGRPMRGYVLVPRYVLNSPPLLRSWLVKGLEYVRALPPKTSRRSR